MNIIAIADTLTKDVCELKRTLVNCNRLNYCSSALLGVDRSCATVAGLTYNLNAIVNTIKLGRDTWTKEDLMALFEQQLLPKGLPQQYSIWVNTDDNHNWSLYGVGAGTSFEEACESFFNGLPINRKFDKAAMTVDGHAVKQYPGE